MNRFTEVPGTKVLSQAFLTNWQSITELKMRLYLVLFILVIYV